MSKKLSIKISIMLKMLLGFVIVGMLSSITVGLVTYKVISGYEFSKVQEKLEMVAKIGADAIDADLHSQLKPGDEDKESYKNLLAKIREFKKISKLEYLYTYVPYTDDKVKFVLDSDESEDQAKIGDEYPEEGETIEDDVKEAFKGNVTVNEEPYTDQWGTFLSGYAPVKNSSGEVVAVVGVDISLHDLKDMQRNLFFLIFAGVIISILLSIIAALLISMKISNPVKLMVNQLDDVVRNSGDLTQELRIRTGDEIEVLAVKTNDLMSNIREIIKKIRETSIKIHNNSNDITDSIENTSEASEAVSKAMGEIASVVGEQANIIRKSTDKIEILSEHINTLSQNSNAISKSARNAMDYTGEGALAIGDLKDKFKVSEDIVAIVSNTVKKLEAKSEEIVKIIEVITNISGQTNLLALNAAIEAARAGEQGKGFAVVAEEIRKLAENTTVSAKEISAHINEVRSQSIETSEAMDKMVETISGQSVSIENTNSALDRITNTVDNISKNILNIDDAVKNVFGEKEEVLQLIRNVHAASENIVAATEEVNASGEEQVAIVESISESIQQLNDLAKELENAVKKFKI